MGKKHASQYANFGWLHKFLIFVPLRVRRDTYLGSKASSSIFLAEDPR